MLCRVCCGGLAAWPRPRDRRGRDDGGGEEVPGRGGGKGARRPPPDDPARRGRRPQAGPRPGPAPGRRGRGWTRGSPRRWTWARAIDRSRIRFRRAGTGGAAPAFSADLHARRRRARSSWSGIMEQTHQARGLRAGGDGLPYSQFLRPLPSAFLLGLPRRCRSWLQSVRPVIGQGYRLTFSREMSSLNAGSSTRLSMDSLLFIL